MNFTPKIIVESVVTGILTVAVAGSTGYTAPSPTPAFGGQGASADRGSVQMNSAAAEMQPAVAFRAARPARWWRRLRAIGSDEPWPNVYKWRQR